MTDGGGQRVEARHFAPPGLLKTVAALLLLIKLALLVTAGPFMDEAYYWLWGQHPALSYYDHPPLSAWFEGLAGALFGWSLFGLRVMVGLTLIGDIFILWLFARRKPVEQQAGHFWTTLAVFLATPIFFAMTAFPLPDHMLIFCCLGALYGFSRFFDRWRTGTPSLPMLYLGALFLGLAGLAKFNAALLGAGIVAYVLADRRLWALLRGPHLYLAGLLALAIQAPVLLWNFEHGFASFHFTMNARHLGGASSVSTVGVEGFLLGALAFISPFLLLPLLRLLSGRGEDRARGLGIATFAVSTLVLFLASLRADILFHWNLVAYLAVLPFIASYFRWHWELVGQLAYGLICAVLIFVNFSVAPVMALVGAPADQASAWSYGWDGVAARVSALRDANGVQFIAGTDYTLASPLAFALRDKDVTSLNPEMDQFDYWFDPAAHRGQTAIIVADHWRPLSEAISHQFQSVELLESVPINRFGYSLGSESIYLGKGFDPDR